MNQLKSNSSGPGEALRMRAKCFAFVFMLIASCPVWAQDGQDLLRQMAESFRTLNYDATIVMQRNGEMSTAQLTHVVEGGNEIERVRYLDGPEVDILRDEHHVDCVHPGGYLLSGTGASKMVTALGERAANVADVYDIQYQGVKRIAGRESLLIEVRPRDDFRYAYELFLDKLSKLLLKSVVRDGERAVESFKLIDLKLGPDVDKANVKLSSPATVRESFHSLPVMSNPEKAPKDWHLSWVPPGFVMSSFAEREHAKPGSGAMVQSMHYTDGFAAFSMFLEAGEESMEAMQFSDGSTLAYSTPKQLGGAWKLATVIGEIPLHTAIKLVNGLVTFEAQEAAE